MNERRGPNQPAHWLRLCISGMGTTSATQTGSDSLAPGEEGGTAAQAIIELVSERSDPNLLSNLRNDWEKNMGPPLIL